MPIVEYVTRDGGHSLLKMPLYEFLEQIHDDSRHGHRFAFWDLRVLVDGKELMPTECARA